MHDILTRLRDAAQVALNKSLEHGLIVTVEISPHGVEINGSATGLKGRRFAHNIAETQLVLFSDVETMRFNIVEEKVNLVVASLLVERERE